MALCKLIDYFPWVVCADDTLKHKPDPESLLKFLETTDNNPENIEAKYKFKHPSEILDILSSAQII